MRGERKKGIHDGNTESEIEMMRESWNRMCVRHDDDISKRQRQFSYKVERKSI